MTPVDRQLTSPWPFPISVVGGQLLRNIPPPRPPLRELAPVRPSIEWDQVDWCPPAQPQA